MQGFFLFFLNLSSDGIKVTCQDLHLKIKFKSIKYGKIRNPQTSESES